jgi:hypothetical protein
LHWWCNIIIIFANSKNYSPWTITHTDIEQNNRSYLLQIHHIIHILSTYKVIIIIQTYYNELIKRTFVDNNYLILIQYEFQCFRLTHDITYNYTDTSWTNYWRWQNNSYMYHTRRKSCSYDHVVMWWSHSNNSNRKSIYWRRHL